MIRVEYLDGRVEYIAVDQGYNVTPYELVTLRPQHDPNTPIGQPHPLVEDRHYPLHQVKYWSET